MIQQFKKNEYRLTPGFYFHAHINR